MRSPAPPRPRLLLPDSSGLTGASAAQLRLARGLLRRKERRSSGLFLADGPQAVREALGRPSLVRQLLLTPEAAQRHRDLLETALSCGLTVSTLDPRQLAGLSDTMTPQGVIAVCEQLHVTLDAALAVGPQLVVCCAQVRDPGNAGTVIRCADAFGAGAVLLSQGSVDPYNLKTVRASAGSLFHLPLVHDVPLEAIVEHCHQAGLQVLAADGSGTTTLDELTEAGLLARPTAWLFGNEAWGLPEEHAALADMVVRVPIYGAAESLNLATAAAVCLYATATTHFSSRRS